ncbi:hypothetical protein F2P56_005880 [Juglans regia]|uniref:Reverse transcriptase Ty1/copia-type domain-containing protein n=1 Tax=Juglans regia TaxID=51240 RepID=A0A833XWR0_JUGRE|nr:hypothetical protein F2P56_005880 [Juglans regia]
MVEDFEIAMMKEYEMTDLGLMRYFLGIQVRQTKGEVFICQEKYIEDLQKKFHMTGCKPVSTPMSPNEKLQQNDEAEKADAKAYRSLVRSLIYLKNTRPDIVHSVSLISRFMKQPSKFHHAAAKRIIRYLQGTKKLVIMYMKEIDTKLFGLTVIGLDHLRIEKAHQATFFVWVQKLLLGVQRSKRQLPYPLQKPNTLQQQMPHVKLYG